MFAFVRTRPGLPAADIQFHMGALYFEDHGQEEFDGHAMTIAPVLVSTKSRGAVWLRSADPLDKPRILTNSLSEPDDVDSLVAGMELAREIAAQPPLAEVDRAGAQARARGRRPRRARGGPSTPADAALPPGRHLPDERRRAMTRSSTPSCGSTGSKGSGSSTRR